MEDQQTQNPHPIIVDTMPTSGTFATLTPNPAPTVAKKTSFHTKKNIGWIVVAVAALVVVGIVIWMLHHKTHLTPQQTLESLEKTSRPVQTDAPNVQAQSLRTVQKTSTPVTATTDDRIKMLNALK